MRTTRVVCVALLALVVAAGTAVAHPRPPLRLNAHFQSFGMYAPETSGNYAFLSNPGGTVSNPAGTAWLRNDATGETWEIPAPTGCTAPGVFGPIGGGWLLEPCSPSTFTRYRLPDGPWQTIPETIECINGGPGNETCEPVAVGTWWVELQTSTEGQSCCGYLYQNLATGAVKSRITPLAGEIDLNDRGLLPTFCPKLEEHATQIWATEGRFALLGRRKTDSDSVLFLDRCGWKRAVRVGESNGVFAAGRSFFVWTSGAGTHLTGVLLPSGRRFDESVPAGASDTIINATNARIYLQSDAGVPISWVGRAP
jgi:hypothetical protein